MSIGPLSPVNFAAAVPLAQAKGAAAERAAQMAERTTGLSRASTDRPRPLRWTARWGITA